jgi:hypothetical protein
MATILETIQNPRAFDAFVNENMKTSTYKIGWNAEMDVEYEASKNWAAATADYAAAMLGTVIDTNAERPKRDMPSIGELSGTLARMGDEWQISNDRLERFLYMEGRFKDRAGNLSNEQKAAQYARLVKYLFNPYELAAIAPHRRILAQYLEGLSDGQVTLTKTNNAGGIVWSAAINVGIAKAALPAGSVVWSTANLATMDVLKVIQTAEDLADVNGKVVIKHRVSRATAALIVTSKQLKDTLSYNFGKATAAAGGPVTLETVNLYLTGIGMKPIEIVNEKGVLNTGTAVSLFKDGRIVTQCAPQVAVLKVSDPLEAIDPVPNKVYTTFNDNLVSQWRNEKGRYVGYEMFAFPAFTGNKDVFITDVTATV